MFESFNQSQENKEIIHTNKEDPEAMERAPKRVFLEVGSGALPAVIANPERFLKNELYIGVDYNEVEIREAKKTLCEVSKNLADESIFINTNGEKLPLANETVDEILFSNVFGEPYSQEFKDGKETKFILNGKTPEMVTSFIKEAQRVLKDNGILVILETNTPAASKEKTLKEILKENNFRTVHRIDSDNPEFISEWREFSTQDFFSKGGFRGKSYILYARKATKQ